MTHTPLFQNPRTLHTTSSSCLLQAHDMSQALGIPHGVWLDMEDPSCWRYRVTAITNKVEDPTWRPLAILHPDGTLVPAMTEDEKERMASVQ